MKLTLTRALWILRCGAFLAPLFLAACATNIKDTRRTFNTVVIDAGHGGMDTGARSRRGSLEKDLTLDVAFRLQRILKEEGFKTVLTRSDDTFVALAERVKISNRQKNTIFVSIHFNSSPRSYSRGVETYYQHSYGRELAKNIQQSMLQTASVNRGVKTADFHVLRNAAYPAVLVECAFLSNPGEDAQARSSAYREQLARQIADGIILQRYGPGGRPAKVLPKLAGVLNPEKKS